MAPKRGRPRKDETDAVSNKKPRLTASAPSKKTTGASKALPSAIPKSSSLGERKVSNGSPAKRGRPLINKSHEIPESDEETTQTHKTKANGIPKSPAKHLNHIYEFYGSDDEPSPSKLRGSALSADSSAQTPSRKAARSAAATGERRTAAPETRTAGTGGTKTKPDTISALGGRGKKSTKRATSKQASHEDEQPEASEDERVYTEEASEDVLNTPSAVRTTTKKGTPLSKPTDAIAKLKGILTPSKRLSERNAKTVAFNEPAEKTDEMFFADLPNKSARFKPKTQAKTTGKENRPVEDAEGSGSESSEEDNEVCAICSKPDSKPPNQILFCDSCDKAVHQKCYGVARIPKGDWLCKECVQEPSAVYPDVIVPKVQATVVAPEETSSIPNFEQHLRSWQRVLLDRCTGKRRIKLCGQDDAYEKTIQLVEQTVMAGEGNSMLIIGARGCGKTTMVNAVLSEVGVEHKDEFHVVRLNGFIHTDDKLALKDIWRQLGKEMEVEDDLIGKTTNYADTLASLLALLSHPSEIAEAQEGMTSRSVVFIIDEFDLFATHARQTLLYNLFDIAQARKAPIAVLGLTNKIDVVESLEKRVKSRFSHRYVYMSLPKTFREYWEICRQGLIIDDEDAQGEGLDVSLKGFAKFSDFWTKKIVLLYKDQAFKDHIEYHYYSSKSAPAFLSGCVLPLANLSPTDMGLRLSPAQGVVFSTEPPDSKLHLLEALSDLDLSLLISAARLDIVAHTDTVNFAMAYDEYTTLIGRQRVQSSTAGMLALGGAVRVWGRGVALMAWERLITLGLLLPTGMGSKHGGLEGRMWKLDVTLEEIPMAVKLNTVLARWCREI